MRPARPYRLVRSGIVAAVTVKLAVVAHVAGHGEVPPIAALLPVVAIAGAVAYVLAARRIAWWELVTLLGVAQVGVHALTSYVTAPHDHAVSGVDPAVMTLSHVVATVLTALLLGYGEGVWWYLRSWFDRRRPVLTRSGSVPWPRPQTVAAADDDLPVGRVCAGPVGMRAPPRVVCSA